LRVTVRKVFKQGNSYTVTLPAEWEVPEILNVYTNDIYFIYTPAKGLKSIFKAELVAQVKRRVALTGKHYTYYLLTIPKNVVLKLRVRPGLRLFILKTTIFDLPAFICVTKEDVYEKATLEIVKGGVGGL